MEEKYMVNDILENVKLGLTTYQNVIAETENMNLRQTIQAIRNNNETFEYDLFKIARTKRLLYTSEQSKPKRNR